MRCVTQSMRDYGLGPAPGAAADRLDAERRRAKAEAALQRIKAASSLSRDVADIVERSLAGA